MVTQTGDYETVRLTVEDDVAELRLTDPDRRNCFSRELSADLYQLTTEIVDNDDVHAVAITADGPVFSAGADLNLVQGNDPDAMDDVHDFRRPVFQWLRNGPVPVVAGAQGPAVGLGADFFNAADLRLAGRDAEIWYPEVDYGISPAEVGVYLADRVGTGHALEILLMGEAGRIDAERAADIGLANRVVDDVREATLEMAGTIADVNAEHGIAESLLETMKYVRRERISGPLEYALEQQEQSRHGEQIVTSGLSVYADR